MIIGANWKNIYPCVPAVLCAYGIDADWVYKECQSRTSPNVIGIAYSSVSFHLMSLPTSPLSLENHLNFALKMSLLGSEDGARLMFLTP